jgi:hypothetical protein
MVRCEWQLIHARSRKLPVWIPPRPRGRKLLAHGVDVTAATGSIARHFRRSGRHYLSPIAVVAKPELIGPLGR